MKMRSRRERTPRRPRRPPRCHRVLSPSPDGDRHVDFAGTALIGSAVNDGAGKAWKRTRRRRRRRGWRRRSDIARTSRPHSAVAMQPQPHGARSRARLSLITDERLQRIDHAGAGFGTTHHGRGDAQRSVPYAAAHGERCSRRRLKLVFFGTRPRRTSAAIPWRGQHVPPSTLCGIVLDKCGTTKPPELAQRMCGDTHADLLMLLERLFAGACRVCWTDQNLLRRHDSADFYLDALEQD